MNLFEEYEYAINKAREYAEKAATCSSQLTTVNTYAEISVSWAEIAKACAIRLLD